MEKYVEGIYNLCQVLVGISILSIICLVSLTLFIGFIYDILNKRDSDKVTDKKIARIKRNLELEHNISILERKVNYLIEDINNISKNNKS